MQILFQDVFVKQDSSRDFPEGCLSYDGMAELQSRDIVAVLLYFLILLSCGDSIVLGYLERCY